MLILACTNLDQNSSFLGVGSPKRNNRKQKKRGTAQNYTQPNRLIDEQMSFEGLTIDPSLNSIKQDVLDCLKMLTKEYLSHNESQKRKICHRNWIRNF